MSTIPNLTIITLNEPEVPDFAATRNKAEKHVQTDWILHLDTDEQLTPELKNEIMKAIKNSQYVAYKIPRLDIFLGQKLKYGENGHNRFVRLIRRGIGHWERPVHEVWVGDGRVGELNSPIIHKLPDISTFLTKINRYSTQEAAFRKQNNKNSSLWQIAIYPFAKFIKNYLFYQGIRDGIPGLIMAGLMSFHSYLTWSKLYLLWHKK